MTAITISTLVKLLLTTASATAAAAAWQFTILLRAPNVNSSSVVVDEEKLRQEGSRLRTASEQTDEVSIPVHSPSGFHLSRSGGRVHRCGMTCG